MASTYLSRTPGSLGNRTTWTFSAWIKVNSSGFNPIFMAGDFSNSSPTGQNGTGLLLLNGQFYSYWDSAAGATSTSALFRDPSGWYHIVLQANTSTLKLYVNNVEMSSKSISGDGAINYTSIHTIGTYPNIVEYFDGSMAHVHFTDGTAYDASAFGETDATTGIWKPKTAPSVTYGTNGFFLKFENSGAFGTDSSVNGNNFTVNGTMTQTIDTPSNVFCTWNPLIVPLYKPSYSNGNTRIQFSTSGSTNQASSTLAANSGKYYSEFKIDASGTIVIGITASQDAGGDSFPGRTSQSWGMLHTGAVYVNDNTSTYPSYGDSFTTGDIIGIAMDLDNNYLYFSKNGTWQNSADPTSGATGTGAIDISSSSASDMMFSSAVETGSCAVSANFGNGYFGTTAVASAGTNASGIGIFEYDVPTGYTALSTKGLNL
jgi:hypothetical protein